MKLTQEQQEFILKEWKRIDKKQKKDWQGEYETMPEFVQKRYSNGDNMRRWGKHRQPETPKQQIIQGNIDYQVIRQNKVFKSGEWREEEYITTKIKSKKQEVDYIREIKLALQEMKPPTYKIIKHTNKKGVDLVIPIADFHYDKKGKDYNALKAERLIEQLVYKVLLKTKHLNINKIYLFVLGDYFHYDTMGNTTTKGTPQDADLGSVEMFRGGIRILGNLCLQLSEVAPVQLSVISGNHDEQNAMALRASMEFAFRDNENIKVTTGNQYREYIKVNEVVFGITHDIKLDKARVNMLTEARHLISANKRFIWLLGHLHNASQVGDYGDLEMWRQPAFCGEDHWTNKEGYKSNKMLQAYVVYDNNEIDTITAKE